LNRHFLRALLASATIVAALALGGCDPDSITPTGRSQAPLSEKTLAEIEAKHMDKDSPVLVRLFKEEAEMEIWKKTRDGEFAMLKTYPVCRWSGDLGPKVKEGDRQAPEGFYTITPGLMNPNSNYYLAFNTGYPNVFDRAWNRTGSELMVHGDCSSRGCYAMTDEQMQEIYALARESFFGGQKDFQFEAFPFRMTALNMAKHRNNSNFAFWKMIKEGYDHFEATHQEPKVAVCEKRYVFDPAAPADASKPLKFDARGKCPAFQLDPTIADAVLDRTRHEQVEMASYIARDVAVVASRNGIDGGMNPVFEAKLGSHTEFDNNGHTYQVAGNSQAPGALPRTPIVRATTAETRQDSQQAAPPPASEPVVLASVPMPPAAPQAKVGEAPPEQPKSIAGLIGNLFGGTQAEAKPTEPAESEQATLRGTNSDTVKPKRVTPIRTAAAPKPQDAAPAKPKAVANNAPAAAPRAPQAAKETKTPEREMRTAYSTPQPANNGGVLPGAQPVVPAGTFENRWTAFR
jgi:murein L,D-transpeptidase YafK